jgi:hypothetical protein
MKHNVMKRNEITICVVVNCCKVGFCVNIDTVGKVNMELQLDATIRVLLISKISSTCFGQTYM